MAYSKINLKKSLGHLKRDKKMAALIRKHGVLGEWKGRSDDPFESLVKSIVYQQISGKAAESILNKFLKLYPNKKFPTPSDVLKTRIPKLRSAGLSNQKATYIKDLALKFEEGQVSPKHFAQMSDEEIITHLIRVKGIGRWTAHMFLMFTLKRPDILPTGDLGIQKGFQKLFGLRKLPSPAHMEKLSKEWAGHRTVACLYLWRVVDGE